jgi:cytochrome c
MEDNAHLGFKNLDLTGIGEISINAEASKRSGAAGGVIEVRLDSPDGELIGQTDTIQPSSVNIRAELRKRRAAWEAGGKKGPEPSFMSVIEELKPRFIIPLDNISGMKTVYFVFKNPNMKDGQIMVSVDEIEFKPIPKTLQ